MKRSDVRCSASQVRQTATPRHTLRGMRGSCRTRGPAAAWHLVGIRAAQALRGHHGSLRASQGLIVDDHRRDFPPGALGQ